MSCVDPHLHLLPGVDDGARDEAEALSHARRMVAEGVREAAVTPHITPGIALDVESIPARAAQLPRAIDHEQLGLRLHASGEIHPGRVPTLEARELELLALGPPGARWLLVEVPFEGVDADFGETLRTAARARLRDRDRSSRARGRAAAAPRHQDPPRTDRARRRPAGERLLVARQPRPRGTGDRGRADAQRARIRARLRRPPGDARAHATTRLRARAARRRVLDPGRVA